MIVWGSRMILETMLGLCFTHWDQNYYLLTRCSHPGMPIRPPMYLWWGPIAIFVLLLDSLVLRAVGLWAPRLTQQVLISSRWVLVEERCGTSDCATGHTHMWIDIDTGPRGSRPKVWAIHQPGSLGDVQYLSLICKYMKVCELSFVDIGVHRTRLIAILVQRGGS